MGRIYDDGRAHREHLPGDLPRKAGATHLGMFFAWCALRGLASDWHGRLDPDRLERLKRREMTGRDYVVDHLGGALEADHLTAEGQAFAERYLASGQYLAEYTAAVAGGLPSPYHVEDSWDVFDRLVPMLDRAHGAFLPAEADAETATATEHDGDAEVVVELEEADVEVEVDVEVVTQPEPVAEPEPEPEDEPAAEPAHALPPARTQPPRKDVRSTFEDVLRATGVAGPPTIESEPDVGPPLPDEEDDDDSQAWTWKDRGQRTYDERGKAHPTGGLVPPVLPDLDGPERTWRTTAQRAKPKSVGWIWAGVVIFLLLYGCGQAL